MLKDERLRKGMTQKQLAEKCNIPFQTIVKYENGQANINRAKIENLLKLCIMLECNLKDILTDDYVIVLLNTYLEGR